MPRDPRAALAIAFDGATRTIDAGLMAGRPFFNIAGIGFDARVAEQVQPAARQAGAAPGRTSSSAYAKGAATARSTIACSSTAIAAASARCSSRSPTAASTGIGARIAPGAELDDGLLDATIVEERSALARFWHARRLVTGTAHLAPRVRTARVTLRDDRSRGAMEFHVDGEPGSRTVASKCGCSPRL